MANNYRAFPERVELLLGNFEKLSLDEKFGINSGISISDTPVDVWSESGIRTFQTTAFTPFIASDDAGDVGQVVTCVIHDENNMLVPINVTLNGTTPVSLGVTATECFRAFTASGESTEINGIVHLATTNNFSGGVPNIQAESLLQIPAGFGQSKVACNRVPANVQHVISQIRIGLSRSSGNAGSALVTFDTRAPGAQFRSRIAFEMSNSLGVDTSVSIGALQPGTDIRLRVRSVSDNQSRVSGSWEYFVVRD